MAFKTLVTNPSSLVRQVADFLQGMTGQRGDFTLAMLVPSETGLSDKWNLVLSAPWIDREGLGATIPAITSALLKHLSRVNAHKLERVSVLPTADRLVNTMSGMRIPLGQVYLVQYAPHGGDAIVLLAEPPGASRSYFSQPVHTRS
jgi:hypothetical protein